MVASLSLSLSYMINESLPISYSHMSFFKFKWKSEIDFDIAFKNVRVVARTLHLKWRLNTVVRLRNVAK